jgi:hypothetical protein
MNSFDIDGVIYINKDLDGVYPGPEDIIITGRSFQEFEETQKMLERRGIKNPVFYNQLTFDQKSRITSGVHKAITLNKLRDEGKLVNIHFEDDPIQIQEIKKIAPWVNVVYLQHDLTNKENVRHTE